MNTNEYIASGIIEQYVLGDVTPQEKKEVECMSHIYTEIQEELIKVQQALEGFAMDNAIEVPKHIKQNIFKQIDEESKQTLTQSNTPKVVNINIKKEASASENINFKKYLVAASVIFVVSISAVFVVLNNRNRNNELAASKKIENLEKDLAYNQIQLQEQSLFNANYYVLQGNTKAPNKSLTVIWNKQTGKVYVNNVSLPQTPSNKQYQLWGLKDNKPVDLGVFDVTDKLQTMKNIQGMQAFAVTLENKGGSPTPHLEELYAITNI